MPRLLLIKLGAIGDVVMAIPAAHAMHASGYQVDWVCGRTVAPILTLYPWINLIPVDENAIFFGSAFAKMRAISTLWRLLLSRPRYDLCATLYYDRRYAILTLPIRPRRSITLSKIRRAAQLIPVRHNTDEYARILLGRSDGETPSHLTPIPVPLDRLPPLGAFSSAASSTRIVLFPGGARNTLRDDALRRWPIENYVALAAALLAAGHQVMLSGSAGDAWASPSFAALPVIDLIAQLPLPETLALLHRSDLVVTHDTGPLHLAGLTLTPLVAIFGPTDPFGRLPQRPNVTAIWGGEGFACRPCYDGRDFAPCAHNGCMHQVTPAMVLAEIDLLFAASRSGRSLLPHIVVPDRTPLVAIAGVRQR